MKKTFYLAAAFFAASASASLAQSPVAVMISPASENVVRSGTEVTLEMREEVTTKGKKLTVGRRIQMATVGDVIHNGVVVIPSGTPAVGEVMQVKNKGMWGKSGYIAAKAVSLNLNGRSVRLTGSFDDKGVTGTAGVVGSIAVIPIAGFFVTGTSAVLPMGGQVKAFLDEDLRFQTVDAPMTLAGPQQVVAPAMRADLPPGVTCETCSK